QYYVFLGVYTVLDLLLNVPRISTIQTLSLHDALPISTKDISPFRTDQSWGISSIRALRRTRPTRVVRGSPSLAHCGRPSVSASGDRKSTRLNSSHVKISYAVFCLKKKMK